MLSLCSSPCTRDCLGVWLSPLSDCWLPALRASFPTSFQGYIHKLSPELVHGPETGPGLRLAKLHDQSHKYTFKTLNRGANECRWRNLWAALKQDHKKCQEKKTCKKTYWSRLQWCSHCLCKLLAPNFCKQVPSPNQRTTLWIGLYRHPKAARQAPESQNWFVLPQRCNQQQPPADCVTCPILLLHNSPLCWTGLWSYVHVLGI